MKTLKVLVIVLLAMFSFSMVNAQPVHHRVHRKHHVKHHHVVHHRKPNHR